MSEEESKVVKTKEFLGFGPEKEFAVNGIAIVPGMSRNGIFYPAKELKKFAPTLTNRPILMDHKNETLNTIGKVMKSVWSEARQQVKYEGWIKHSMVRERVEDGRLQHVSIGAIVSKLVEEELEDGTTRYAVEGLTGLELSTIPVPGIASASISHSLSETLKDIEDFKAGNRKQVRALMESFSIKEQKEDIYFTQEEIKDIKKIILKKTEEEVDSEENEESDEVEVEKEVENNDTEVVAVEATKKKKKIKLNLNIGGL